MVVQIESREGVRNIEEILSVPGIGAVMIGSFDLSTSLGVAGDVTADVVSKATSRVVRACLERGIPVGATAGELDANIAAGQKFLSVRVFGGLAPWTAENLKRAKELRRD